MVTRSIGLSDDLQSYLATVGWRDLPVLRTLRDETARIADSYFQIAPEQGQFLAMLVTLTGARRILEIGTFTGYSSLCMALSLPPDGGRLVALDCSEQWTAVARRHWAEAEVADRIELRLGDAHQESRRLIADGWGESFDFAFIDAEKTGYDDYYECALKLVRSGGLICFDNMLWEGKVADERIVDPDTVALRALNRKLHGDPRVSVCLVPIGDGLTLARRTEA